MSLLDTIGLTRKITRPRVKAFLERHQSDELTLDVGAGTDAYRHLFPNRKTLDIEQRPGVQIDYIADAHHLPFEDGTFGCVVCIAVLEHVHVPQQVVDEMHRVLKPGGTLLVSVPFAYPIHDSPNDFWRFTKYGLLRLLGKFEIVEFYADTNTLEAMGVLFQRLGFQCETLGWRPFKIFWFLLAKFCVLFSGVLTKQYGDISHKTVEKDILSTGYSVAARKR
jgi:SAM-dependent methyltransferase